MHTCRVCGRIGVREHLDFGPQAIRNRFLRSSDELEFTHPLSLGYCGMCGVVQLTDPPPVDEVRPRFDWISYNEPERHLDNLVQSLTKLPGITPTSTFAGLTYKDDSTLARLNRLGFANTWRPDLRADLGIESPFAGVESVQQKLRPENVAPLAAKFGRPDVLIVRHVLEHTHDTRAALAWAARLVEPGGYVVFEVPDAVRALDRLEQRRRCDRVARRLDHGKAREVLGREDVELRGVTSARDVHDTFIGPVLDRHLGCREKARQVDEQLPWNDDGAVGALDRQRAVERAHRVPPAEPRDQHR